jgi:tetratricopeptide (TPR) repeat protein
MPYLVQGAAFNSMQRFDDALRSLTSGLHLAPQMWQAYFEMAKAYLGKGEFPNALQQVRKAEELGGQQYAPVHLVKAHALVGAKEYNKAAAELELYISRDPQSAGASAARQELNQVKAFAASQ